MIRYGLVRRIKKPMIAKYGVCVYIGRMKMSKQSTNIAQICASLIIGFTQISFAATEEPKLLDIPPPPSLQGSTNPAMPSNSGNKVPAAAIGTSKNEGSSGESKSNNSSQGVFAKASNGVSATSTQSDNANAVNAAAEAARRAAIPSTPVGVLWINQVFPAANTMYSNPQRK